MCGYVACVPECRGSVCCASQLRLGSRTDRTGQSSSTDEVCENKRSQIPQWCREWALKWMTKEHSFDSRKGERFLSSPKRAHRSGNNFTYC
jgi:hypothetical protein